MASKSTLDKLGRIRDIVRAKVEMRQRILAERYGLDDEACASEETDEQRHERLMNDESSWRDCGGV